jgi:2,3-bisphosphoglycerate-independent phosphoglycerate mutase
MSPHRVILIVRDGWGYTTETRGNAVQLANTPNNDRYLKMYPWSLLKCTGNAVGVPEGTQGGSEPGHLTIGAGRVVWQPLEKINRSIIEGSFQSNKVLQEAVLKSRERGSKLHLMGLLSDQGIHGSIQHLYALLDLSLRKNVEDVYIHCFLDGRDVPERSAEKFLRSTIKKTGDKGVGRIASMVGRYYAMDRDNNWDRTKKAYELLTTGKGHMENDVVEAIFNAYKRGDSTDYYVEPIVFTGDEGQPLATIDPDDSVIFWNYRSDRARQLTYSLTLPHFDRFHRGKYPEIFFTCMSVYDLNLDLPVAFPQKKVKKNLGQILALSHKKQLRIAETEKYAHVTFFFNSQVEKPEPGEDRILVPSPKVPSYEDKPEMSAYEITAKLVKEINNKKYDFILVNYANGDLVGHSANLQAGVKACEVVDQCVGCIVDEGLKEGYVILVTGDHGNIETMCYPNGEPNPSHGTNPVPFILISDEPVLKKAKLKTGLGLSCVAPTILKLMKMTKPVEMNTENIIIN